MVKEKSNSDGNGNEKTLAGGVTQQQINAWKEKYDVHQIDVKDPKSGKKFTCYIKETEDRNVLTRFASLVSQNKIGEAGGLILTNCWLGGDEAIKTNDKLYMAACMQANSTVNLPESSIKKI